MTRFKYGKFKTIINGIQIIFYQHDVHQYSAGQQHLRTVARKTYISSRWVKARAKNKEFKSFKVKVTDLDYETALDKAISKVENLTKVYLEQP